VSTGAIKCAKLQSNHHHQQTNIQQQKEENILKSVGDDILRETRTIRL